LNVNKKVSSKVSLGGVDLMRPNKTIIIRVLLIVLATTIAGFSMYQYKDYVATNRPLKKVLVAKADILPYAVITSESLVYKQLPEGSKHEKSVQDPKEIVGKKTTETIYKGEQILPQKLTESSLALKQEDRAVGIPIDIVKAAGMTINPGNNVDVYWLEGDKATLTTEEDMRQAELIAVNATILDVLNTQNQSMYNITTNAEEGKAPTVAVLKVNNSEVQSIITAIGNGTIYLAKRQ